MTENEATTKYEKKFLKNQCINLRFSLSIGANHVSDSGEYMPVHPARARVFNPQFHR